MIDLLIIGLLIIGDQLVKFLTYLNLQDRVVVIWDGVFQLTYVENRGAAFGLMQNQRIFFLIFTVIVVGIIYAIFRKIPHTKRFLPLRIAGILFFAGAIGNWIDRLRLKYVIDTFYFNLIDFPVFNVADSYVTISTILFAILMIFYYKDHEFDFLKRKKTPSIDAVQGEETGLEEQKEE